MSCRFQPDYRGDDDFRGQAGLLTEPCLDFTFDILDGPYLPDIVWPDLVPRDKFLDLACGETLTNIAISETSNHALYRTTDITTNKGHLARFFLIEADDPVDYAVILSNVSEFSPYVTVHRSGTIQWQGVPVLGRFAFSVSVGETGPMTIEVSTLTKHEKGTFDIELVCDEQEIEAEFSFDPETGAAPLDVDFTDESVSTYDIETYDWNFGDGTTHGSTQNPSHTFNEEGTYTVTLTITDVHGRTDSVSHDVVVGEDPLGPPICGSVLPSVNCSDFDAILGITMGSLVRGPDGYWRWFQAVPPFMFSYLTCLGEAGGGDHFWEFKLDVGGGEIIYTATRPGPTGVYNHTGGGFSGAPGTINIT